MLVLTRGIGEVVYIGNAKLTVLDVNRHQIKLGFDAPKDITIVREEIIRRGEKPCTTR